MSEPVATTPDQMRALADRLEADAKRLIERAAQLRGAADTLDGNESDLRPAFPGPLHGNPPRGISPLPSADDSAITYSMESTQIDSAVKKRRTGPPLKSKGPVAKVARILGVSVAEVARRVNQNVYSMRTWNERDQVPLEVKEKMADLVSAYEKTKKHGR